MIVRRLPVEVTDNSLPRFVPRIPIAGITGDWSAYAARAAIGETVLELEDRSTNAAPLKGTTGPTLVRIGNRKFLQAPAGTDARLSTTSSPRAITVAAVWQAQVTPASPNYNQIVAGPAVLSLRSDSTLATFAGSVINSTLAAPLNTTHVSMLSIAPDPAASVLRHNGVEVVVNPGPNTNNLIAGLGYKGTAVARFVTLGRFLDAAERALLEKYLLDLTRDF